MHWELHLLNQIWSQKEVGYKPDAYYNDFGTFIYMNLYSADECSEQSHGFLSEKLQLLFYVFVLCIVIQLCNVNQQMHTFKINVLIQFLVSSTCFEHHVFIIRKTICTCGFYGEVFHAFM